MSAGKVGQSLNEMRAVEGAPYGWHYHKPGGAALPAKEPVYSRGKYPAEYVKSHGINRTGLGKTGARQDGASHPHGPRQRLVDGRDP